MENYIIEMLNITKQFGSIKANDNVTLQLKKGEIHALLGENGAGKSTLMSILFGLYQADSGMIKKDGVEVKINNPNDATALGIGMVHQHFKLVDVFTVLDNIILGAETTKFGFLKKKEARERVQKLSEEYGLSVDLDAKIEDITVGMQQRVEILKMLYRDNDILIFDEPTAVLIPQEIEELLSIMKKMAESGKSILFISHKLNEIMSVANRCTILRKGQYVGTVNIADTSKEQLSEMMVGRKIDLNLERKDLPLGEEILRIENLSVKSKVKKGNAVNEVSLSVRAGEIVCIAGIDGNGQTEFIHGLTGLEKISEGKIYFKGNDITNYSIRNKTLLGISHIPEDRHKHGLILDFTLENNMVLQRYFEPEFQKHGFIKKDAVREYSDKLIEQYDVRSSEGSVTIARGLDVGAIEYIHKKIIAQRDAGKAVLLVSLELEEVMNLPDRILVMYEGQIVGELDPKKTNVNELGLYMSGAKTDKKVNG